MNCVVCKGHRYRARIEVPWFKRAFANEDIVRGRLEEVGFVDITVKKDENSSGRYWAWGVWPNPDTSSDVDEIEELEDLTP
jgi:hypothetical protein